MTDTHIQELAEKIYHKTRHDGMTLAEIINTITQALNNQWVRVEDRLPEPERFYITYANKHTARHYYGLNNKGDLVWWQNDEQVRPHMIPTHWQPLPAPPTE